MTESSAEHPAEQQLEAEMLWQELAVGDEVMVEFPVCEAGRELLSPGQGYLILAKRQSASGVPQLVTESNIPGQQVTLYPHCICSYRCLSEQQLS
ncbi:hypothetical protein DV711_14870 [Motiliproteus coralliicola]|uniref:DUF4926 domain-containing protein n=1 Tax=Motiliproteus coralliicola TaxID=2283196 RepID=A0A369WDX2_9GAMM|nr:hypothetical protein [Motiliproteus coralliicola]RDE18894.1 hypothetical protein DV711_14870 [Motiliproteus coralliicola]